MSCKIIRTDDVQLTCKFQPVYNAATRDYRPPAAGVTKVSTTRTFNFELPADAQPRPQDQAKGGGIWAHVIVGNSNKKSLPFGWKVINVSPRNSYITASTKSIKVTFEYQSDTKPGHWDLKDRNTKTSTLVLGNISLVIYYTTASERNNYTGTRHTKTEQGGEQVQYTEYTTNIDHTTDSGAYKNCITIYEPDAEEFVTNGLGILQPSKCIVTEQAGGSWQLEMQHPISDDGRWKLFQVDRIIRAPVPLRQNPEMSIRAKREGISVHEIYKANTTANLRNKPNTKTTTKIIRKLLLDEQVEVIESGSWDKIVTKNGETGYVANNLLTFVRQEETESAMADGEQYNSVVTAQQTRNQVFRIYNVEVDATGNQVSVNARHISYDFASNLINGELKAEKMLLSTFLPKLKQNLAVVDERTIDTDITNKYVSGKWQYTNPLSILLDPDTGVVQQLQCQLIRDTHSIYLLDNTPADRGYVISYGKNLKSLKWTYNTEEIVTRIMPTGQTKKGDVLLLPQVYIDSTHISEYPVVKCSRLEVSQAVVGGQQTDETTGEVIDEKLTQDECYTLMRQAAQQEYDNGCDLPKVDVEVDFTALETTEEYAELAGLYQLYLYDTVHIRHEPLGYEADAQVYETEFDCVLGRYNKLKLGDIFKQSVQTVAGYQLSEGSVSGTKIAPSTITGTNLADASITNAKIGYAAISAANISDINADTIKTGTLTTDRLVVTGEASIAGQLNTASAEAISGETVDKTNTIAYISNDALAVTDEGLVMKSGGKIAIVAGAEFTVESRNLDINENGTLSCTNASISGSISSNGYPVLTGENIVISTNAPASPSNGTVWIRPAGGATACTYNASVQSRMRFQTVLTFVLDGSGAYYGLDDAQYALQFTYWRGMENTATFYIRAEITDGVNTVDFGGWVEPHSKYRPAGNYKVTMNATGAWVCSGSTVTLRVWSSATPTGTKVDSLSSHGVAAGSSIKLIATGAGSSQNGWQSCTVHYYQE